MTARFQNRAFTDHIVIHSAATKPTQNIGIETIRRWHKQRGFLDVGYHFVIRRGGQVETGRPVRALGAHASGFNARSVGICYIGGVDENNQPSANMTPAQDRALVSLLTQLRAQFPEARIVGHRDLPNANTECPSFDVAGWLKLRGLAD